MGEPRATRNVSRAAALTARAAVLLTFATLFAVPLAWLVLAPTKPIYLELNAMRLIGNVFSII